MSIRRPAISLAIDGRELTGPEAAAASVLIQLRIGGLLDRARLALAPLSPLLDSEPGAVLELSAGYGNDLVPVFKGAVTAVWQQPWGTTLEALTKAAALTRCRVGRSYVRQQVGDIVRDLLSAAQVDPGEIDGQVEMAVYHVDEQCTVWQHLNALGSLTGREVSSGPDGAVHFIPPKTGAPDHTLRTGAELVAWELGGFQAGVMPPPTAAVSAAGEQGADAWHLLSHEPGGKARTLLNSAIRDIEAAQAWSDGLKAAAARKGAGGWLLAVGDPSLRAGDLVEIEDVPRGAVTYRVLAADHLLDGSGLTTRLKLEAA
jgi:phage protein D